MKSLVDYIKESKGSSFKNEVKFSAKNFEAWKKEADNKVELDEIDDDNVCIYIGRKHIGTYNKKTQILTTDDVSLFGNYID